MAYTLNFGYAVYRKYGLDDNTVDFIGHALAMYRDDDYLDKPAMDFIKKMKVRISPTPSTRYFFSPRNLLVMSIYKPFIYRWLVTQNKNRKETWLYKKPFHLSPFLKFSEHVYLYCKLKTANEGAEPPLARVWECPRSS